MPIESALLNQNLPPNKPSATHIAFASFIGTAIEFYDFYIYAMASALVIGQVFFPASDPATQALNAFLTFGIAFIARPLGAFVYVVNAEKTVQIRRITIGAIDGDKVAILANLAPNEMVVLEGIDKLHEGSQVDIAKKDGQSVAESSDKKANSADKPPKTK